MAQWFWPLGESYNALKGSYLDKLTKPNWFPGEGCVICSENGSMEKYIIPLFIEHLNRFVRKHVHSSNDYLLLLDGHSSRNGADWLVTALSNKCQVAQSPANTSHELQPCDRDVNKKFKSTSRKVRDEICEVQVTDTRTMRVKLAVARKNRRREQRSVE